MDYLLRQNNTMFHEKERKIKAIQKTELNNICIDCNNKKPEYISLNNACFICKHCFKNHQKFPLGVSKPIKNNLRSLTLRELQYLYFGGNKKLFEFKKYEYPKLFKLNPLFSYKTLAMQYYRNWLKYLIEGGKKPQRPEVEIAYHSIEDKEMLNKNYLNNNENNIITIDFYNDCYNYNNNYNQTLNNFINRNTNLITPRSNYYTYLKSECQKKNLTRYNSEKVYYDKINSTNYINYLNEAKNIDKDYYNKCLSTENNNNNFYHSQSNFLPKKNIIPKNYIIYNRLELKEQNNEDLLLDNSKVFNTSNFLNKIENKKTIYNDKVITPFKTNKPIYIKPKYSMRKSLEKTDFFEQKDNYFSQNNKKEKNEKFDKNYDDHNILIKVKRNNKKYENKKENEIKIYKGKNKNNNNTDIIINNNNGKKINNFKNETNKSKNNSKPRLIKKRNNFNYNLDKLDYILNSNGSTNEKKNNITKDIKKNITSRNKTLNNNNKIIFKKKNLRNSFYLSNKIKTKRNYSLQKSKYSKSSQTINSISNDDDLKNNYDNYDNFLKRNISKTLFVNNSMKNFYPHYPIRMNMAKIEEIYLNNDRINENEKEIESEIEKLLILRKQKSEIIKSLKILLKRKEALNKDIKEENDSDYEEEEEEEEEGEEEEEKNKNYYDNNNIYKYKNLDKNNLNNLIKKIDEFKKDKKKKIKININKEDEDNDVKKTVYNQVKKPNNNKNKKININKTNEYFSKEQEKEFIRNKYKKKYNFS